MGALFPSNEKTLTRLATGIQGRGQGPRAHPRFIDLLDSLLQGARWSRAKKTRAAETGGRFGEPSLPGGATRIRQGVGVHVREQRERSAVGTVPRTVRRSPGGQ